MAAKEQGRPAGAGDQTGQRPHPVRDGQDWFTGRRDRLGRPRGPARFLLPGARSEGLGLFAHLAALQDQADLKSGCSARLFHHTHQRRHRRTGSINKISIFHGGAYRFRRRIRALHDCQTQARMTGKVHAQLRVSWQSYRTHGMAWLGHTRSTFNYLGLVRAGVQTLNARSARHGSCDVEFNPRVWICTGEEAKISRRSFGMM